jgi:hypothetical protein
LDILGNMEMLPLRVTSKATRLFFVKKLLIHITSKFLFKYVTVVFCKKQNKNLCNFQKDSNVFSQPMGKNSFNLVTLAARSLNTFDIFSPFRIWLTFHKMFWQLSRHVRRCGKVEEKKSTLGRTGLPDFSGYNCPTWGKCTKLQQNIPNGHEVYQMAVE